MSSHYDNEKSKEASRDIGDKVFKLKPFDALGVFVLCALLSFGYFAIGGLSLSLIDYLFEMNWVETIGTSIPSFLSYIIFVSFGAFIWTILLKLQERYE
jgi:hypothetical protein